MGFVGGLLVGMARVLPEESMNISDGEGVEGLGCMAARLARGESTQIEFALLYPPHFSVAHSRGCSGLQLPRTRK